MLSDFYVGYLPVPPGLKKTLRRIAAALLMLAGAVAGWMVVGQNPFPDARFEFGRNRDFRGVLILHPTPVLVVPDQALPWLLVAPGKHGLRGVDFLDRHEVRLTGQRIFRGADHMIEVQPESLRDLGPVSLNVSPVDLGPAVLTGEIVDSKCYLGVMNPGNGKIHRDCAVRCISGGVPPAFLVRDSQGQAKVMLLENFERELLDHIAEPVTLHGRLMRSSGQLIFRLE